MSIISTPTLNATETIQVATPFSYSFTYSTVIQTSDVPVYYYNGGVISNGTSNGINLYSNEIKFISDLNPIKVTGLTYTVSNMTATTDVLECRLPLLNASYSFDAGSSVTFGGPTKLFIEGGPPGAGGITGHYASFSGVGKFAYGLDDSTEDTLQYIPLVGTPVSSFRIKLTRPQNDYANVDCTITNNVMSVTKINGQLYGGGQVTVGMIFPVQGGPSGLTRAFTVASYLSSYEPSGHYGGQGTYGITPNDAGAPITVGSNLDGLYTDYVAGSGDIIFSNSMTPSDGTAQFVMDANWTYSPEV